MGVLRPARYELVHFRDLSSPGIAGGYGEGAFGPWPRVTSAGAAPAGRRAVLAARRIFVPQDMTVLGIVIPNDGGINAAMQARRAKFALFNANGNTGYWRGVNGTDTGLPSTVRPGNMAQSILVGPEGTAGTAQNLYRGGANGSARGLTFLFDTADLIPAGTWIWAVLMCELLYNTTDGAADTAIPNGGTLLTPHQNGGSGNSRNLVWPNQIGDGTTAALGATDVAATAWSNFENSTSWVNQTSATAYTLSAETVNMTIRDLYGELLCQF